MQVYYIQGFNIGTESKKSKSKRSKKIILTDNFKKCNNKKARRNSPGRIRRSKKLD
jgi:hypothetical protein